MKIIKAVVKTFQEDAYCQCGGKMLHDNSVLGTKAPFEYGHVCEICGHREYSKIIYPHIFNEYDHTVGVHADGRIPITGTCLLRDDIMCAWNYSWCKYCMNNVDRIPYPES